MPADLTVGQFVYVIRKRIKLSPEKQGLPPGVHLTPAVIAGNTQGPVVFHADESAAEWTGTVKLFAAAKIGEKTIRREVRPYTRVWSEASVRGGMVGRKGRRKKR